MRGASAMLSRRGNHQHDEILYLPRLLRPHRSPFPRKRDIIIGTTAGASTSIASIVAGDMPPGATRASRRRHDVRLRVLADPREEVLHEERDSLPRLDAHRWTNDRPARAPVDDREILRVLVEERHRRREDCPRSWTLSVIRGAGRSFFGGTLRRRS